MPSGSAAAIAHHRPRCRRLGGVLACASALLTWLAPAGSETRRYPLPQREVRACVLLPSAPAAPVSPHLLRVLDAAEEMADGAGSPLRPGVKPAGWALTNPLAPATVTPALQARWPDLPAGAPVTKEMAAYWEAFLDTTPLEDLLRFDLLVLSLPAGVPARFPPAAREKLRRLVERGATLWIDAGGASIDPTAPFFLRELGFSLGTADDPGAFRLSPADVPGTVPADRRPLCTRHPLLTRPWRLTQAEIEALGNRGPQSFLHRVTNLAGNGLPDPLLLPILFSLGAFGDGGRGTGDGVGGGSCYPVMVAGAYGDGLVVAENLGIAAAINDGFSGPPGTAGNRGATCGTWPAGQPLTPSFLASAKWAYNLCEWAVARRRQRTASLPDGPRAPLEPARRLPLGPNRRVLSAPVFRSGLAFVLVGDTATPAGQTAAAQSAQAPGNPAICNLQSAIGMNPTGGARRRW